MTAPSREALESRLAELNWEIADYPYWGGKLTAMDEERRGIGVQLAALPEQPTPDAQPEAAREMRERVEAIYWLLQSQDETTDHGLAEKIEAEIIAPLTAELDAANARAAENEEMAQYAGEEQFRAEQAEAALATARAERDRAVAQLVGMTKDRDGWKSEFQLYTHAWFRALDHRLFGKRHQIDALVKTTKYCRERADRLDVIERQQREAAAVAEYGPSNADVRARTTASPVKREGE